ncbi:MAG: Crp/Fnr family transcriptional regulator [Gammaproteobacteria bacterium]|jgi:CRP/FNR family cyclic AMP-dependent transcriptional regulator
MSEDLPIFSSLAESEREFLSRHAVTRVFPKNCVIINEGDSSDTLYIVLSGRVKAYLSDEQGKEIVLNFHGPGEYFGEMALFDDAPRSASVVTLERSRLSIISRTDFTGCVSRNPELALQIIRGLVRRLRTATENVRSLALMDVYGRVARLLLHLAEPENGHLVIREQLTQQDIADRVGSSREMISRILKDLKTGGYVTMRNRQIVIKEKIPPHW